MSPFEKFPNWWKTTEIRTFEKWRGTIKMSDGQESSVTFKYVMTFNQGAGCYDWMERFQKVGFIAIDNTCLCIGQVVAIKWELLETVKAEFDEAAYICKSFWTMEEIREKARKIL